jgi:hypothetical protein
LNAFYQIEEGKGNGEGPATRNGLEDKDAKDAGNKNARHLTKKQNEDKDERNSRQDDDDDTSSSTDEATTQEQDPASRIAYLTALSRGELDVSSSSSDESENDDDDDGSHSSDDYASDTSETDIMGKAGILDPSFHVEEESVERTLQDDSPYLAVLNMDWSAVRAVDIFAVVSSFTTPGSVRRVQVFTSNFGMERMEQEERIGPSSDLWKSSQAIRKSQGSDVDVHDDNDSIQHDETDSQNDSFEEALTSDFDTEKLRAYEASRLKYYFAVVEMSTPTHADTIYKEVDGLEFEHSSAALDVRIIPVQELPTVIQNRPMRDEAVSIPSNYEPPDFVVSALQQTNVQCTWEAGDRERERTLTKYISSQQDWRKIAESDDLKAYLASDASSDEEEEERGKGKSHKASQMRKMLGLDSDDDVSNEGRGRASDIGSDEEEAPHGSDAEKVDTFLTFDNEEGGDKQASFVPGEAKLEDKIRSSIAKKKSGSSSTAGEPTPWESYLERKKQKRKERKAMARARREEINEARRRNGGLDGSIAKFDVIRTGEVSAKRDETKADRERDQAALELLAVDAEGDQDEARDFDMRGLQKVEKLKSKRLKGARKRKETALAATVMGGDFQVDTQDERFKAVLDGMDDRFGIDRTDPQYKETPAMRQIMDEQTRRRQSNKSKRARTEIPPDALAEQATGAITSTSGSTGASALSSLVRRLKEKVSN